MGLILYILWGAFKLFTIVVCVWAALLLIGIFWKFIVLAAITAVCFSLVFNWAERIRIPDTDM